MKKLTKLFLVFVFFANALFAIEKESLLKDLLCKQEFEWFIPYSVSPNGNFLCYCTIDRENIKENKTTLEVDETLSFAIGTRLFIKSIQTDEIVQIGPNDSNCWSPVWSPDGEKIAFYSDFGGKGARIWLYDMNSHSAKQICSEFIHSFFPIVWDTSSEHLYFYLAPESSLKEKVKDQKKRSLVDLLSSSSSKSDQDLGLATIAAKMGSAIGKFTIGTETFNTIVPYDSIQGPTKMILSSSGKYLAYLSYSKKMADTSLKSNFDLFLVNLKTQENVCVAKELLSQKCHNKPILWHPYKDELVYLDLGKLHIVLPENGMEDQEISIEETIEDSPFLFVNEGRCLLLGSKNSLALVDLNSYEVSHIELDSDLRFDSCVLDKQKNMLIIKCTSTAADSVLLLYDFQSQKLKTLDREKAVISHVKWTKNGVSALVENLNKTKNVALFLEDKNRWERITDINPNLKDLPSITCESFTTTVPLYDGSLISLQTAILLPPGKKKGDKVPAIVSFYPGSNCSKASSKFYGGDVAGGIPQAVLLEKGYAIILPDCPLEENGKPTNPIDALMDVLLPQIYKADFLGYVDINRLGIMGHSYGGYGTAAVISRTHLFKVALAFSGAYDLPGSYGYIDEYNSFFSRYWSEKSQGGMGSHPWAEFLRYIRNSPYYAADNILTPVLILHGKSDQTCFVQEAQKFFTALERLGKEARLLIYPGDHCLNEWPQEEAIDACEKVIEFIQLHCPVDSTL